jgi:hypothetical protein
MACVFGMSAGCEYPDGTDARDTTGGTATTCAPVDNPELQKKQPEWGTEWANPNCNPGAHPAPEALLPNHKNGELSSDAGASPAPVLELPQSTSSRGSLRP